MKVKYFNAVCLFLLINLLCQNVFAAHWIEGYIILKDDNLIWGYIKKDWKGDFGPKKQVILFRDNHWGAISTYSTEQVKHVFIRWSEEYYISDSVYTAIEQSPIHGHAAVHPEETDTFFYSGSFNQVHFVKKPAFLHVLVETNSYCLYEAVSDRHRYFIRDYYTGDGTINELIYVRYPEPFLYRTNLYGTIGKGLSDGISCKQFFVANSRRNWEMGGSFPIVFWDVGYNRKRMIRKVLELTKSREDHSRYIHKSQLPIAEVLEGLIFAGCALIVALIISDVSGK